MKPRSKLLNLKILATSAIPLLAASTCYLVEHAIVYWQCLIYKVHHLTESNPQYPNDQQLSGRSLESSESSAIRQFKEASISVYSYYTYFLATMLVLHFGMSGAKFLMKWLKGFIFPGYNQLKEISTIVTTPCPESCSAGSLNHQDSWEMIDLKTIGIHMLRVILLYSLVFCIYIMLYCVVQYCLYICLYVLHMSRNGRPETPRGQIESAKSLLQTSLANSTHLNLMDTTHKSERMLTEQDEADVVGTVFDTIPQEELDSIKLQLNGTEVILFGLNHLYSVNDIFSTARNFTLRSALDPGLSILAVSPNGQTVLYTNSSDLFVANISDLNSTMKLDGNYPSAHHYTFKSNGKVGFFLNNGDVLQFNAYSPEVVKILDVYQTNDNCLALTADDKLLIVASLGIMVNEVAYHDVMYFVDVTKFESPINLGSATLDEWVVSIAVSYDAKTLFIRTTYNLHVMNISDLTSLQCCSSNIYAGPNYDTIVVSPDDNTVIIIDSQAGTTTNIVDVADLSNLNIYTSTPAWSAQQLVFLPKTGLVFMKTKQGFQIASPFINIDIEDAQPPFTSLNFPMTTITLEGLSAKRVLISNDSKKGIIVCNASLETLIISDEKVTLDQDSPSVSYSYSQTNRVYDSISWTGLSYDSNTVFVSSYFDSQISMINAKTGEISYLPSRPSQGFTLSSDGKTLFYFDQADENSVNAFDLVNLTSSNKIVTTVDTIDYADRLLTVNGELLTALVEYRGSTNPNLNIYNISDMKSVVTLSSNNLNLTDYNEDEFSIAVSSDTQTVFAISSMFLRILDIADPRNVKYLAQTLAVAYSGEKRCFPKIFVSGDPKIVFVPLGSNIQVVNISNRTNPVIVAGIPTEVAEDGCISITSLSNSTAFPILITDESPTLKIVSSKPQFVINLPILNFGRGEVVLQNILLLEKTVVGKYTMKTQGYRFAKISLHISTLEQVSFIDSYPALPNWISFDKNTEVLTVAPTSQEAVAQYLIYTALSTPILPSMFNALDLTTDPEELMTTLLMCGYLDNNQYITANFNPTQPLVLPSAYKNNETAIRGVLKDSYFEMDTKITVSSSLSLLTTDVLTVTTKSQLSLTVTISLQYSLEGDPQKCQFVTKFPSMLTPTFSNDNMVIDIVGPPFETNNVLANIVISSVNNRPCDGIMNITDHLNSDEHRNISDISQYFQMKQCPDWNWTRSLQDEISQTPLQTGTYFIILLQESMFNQTDLVIELAKDDHLGWLTQTGFSLTGTPPEPSYPRFWSIKYDVTIQVHNQYKMTPMSFTLKVNMSLTYYFKWFLKLFGIISAWVYLNMFLNIICKKRYRYPKDWPVKVGEPITPSTLYPVAFIRGELAEARFIIKEVQRYLANELNYGLTRKVRLAEYFYDQKAKKLDTAKLLEVVDKVVSELPTKKRDKVRRYAFELNSRKELIHQLILNDTNTEWLYMSQEKLTRQIFDELKNKWIDLIDKDEANLWQLSVNRSKLESELESKGDTSIIHRTPALSRAPSRPPVLANEGLEVELMNRSTKNKPNLSETSEINVSLLEGALLAYAFSQHHLNVRRLDINVIGKERYDGYRFLPRIMNRFLKLDLRLLLLDKGNRIGHGIKYQIESNVLEFYGTPKKGFIGKLVVIQITNRRGRILREILVYGVEGSKDQNDQTPR